MMMNKLDLWDKNIDVDATKDCSSEIFAVFVN